MSNWEPKRKSWGKRAPGAGAGAGAGAGNASTHVETTTQSQPGTPIPTARPSRAETDSQTPHPQDFFPGRAGQSLAKYMKKPNPVNPSLDTTHTSTALPNKPSEHTEYAPEPPDQNAAQIEKPIENNQPSQEKTPVTSNPEQTKNKLGTPLDHLPPQHRQEILELFAQATKEDKARMLQRLEDIQKDKRLHILRNASPLEWVINAFDWDKGELKGYEGPDVWQVNILQAIGDGILTLNEAIRIAVASGHGIGKSALVSWIILWAVSTMKDTKGVVTANTENQLKTKTWAELAKWHRLSFNKEDFVYAATALFSSIPEHEKTWRIDMVPWSVTNTEAFAGLHNQGRRVLMIYDEASAIPDAIWEVSEGALTDANTEIIWCCFGNPTRGRGRFYDCFHKFKQRWKTRQIDSATVARTNKKQIQEWIDDYGEESDFVKVRVRGVFPSTDANALLSQAEVDASMARSYRPQEIAHAPRIMGVDVARQGTDDSVIAKRQGQVVYPVKALHIPDTHLVAEQVAIEMDVWGLPDSVNVDATGGYGVGVIDALRTMNRRCIEVYFSGKPSDSRYANKRSEMWMELAKWVKAGGQLPNDKILKEELCAATYTFSGDKFALCSKDDIKEEIGRSPDRADAVALTFAFPIAPRLTDHQYLRSVGTRKKFDDRDPFEGA